MPLNFHHIPISFDLSRMMDHSSFISFSGIITFPKEDLLRELVRRIPLERQLIETDAPYLVPQAFRGRIKRNAVYVKEVAHSLAEIKNVPLVELAEKTTKNFQSLFLFEI